VSNVDQELDVVELIRQQHAQVRQTMETIVNGPADGRGSVFEELASTIKAHETAEQTVVYPALRQMGDDGARVADARVAEEETASKALAELQAMDASSAAFADKFSSFRADVEAHASSEEAEVLPLIMKRDAGDRRQMAEAFNAAESKASA
jgi:hemerythrin superfamily protein